LKDLVEKLERQQRFIESEIVKLSNPEFSKSKHTQDLIDPLWRYLLFVHILLEMPLLTTDRALKNIHDKLDILKAKYDGGKMKHVKRMLMVQLDKDEIAGLTQRLEDSFRFFMVTRLCSCSSCY
jgi:hypothetical protein